MSDGEVKPDSRHARSFSLRARIARQLAIALLPFCLLGGLVEYTSSNYNISVRNTAAVVQGRGALLGQGVVLQEAKILLQTFSALPLSDTIDKAACETAFHNILTQNLRLYALILVSASGKPVCGSPDIDRSSQIADSEWLQRTLAMQQFTVSPWNTKSSPATAAGLIAAIPVLNAEHKFTGALAALISSDTLMQSMQAVQLPDNAAIGFLDSSGILLAQRTNSATPNLWLPKALPASAGLERTAGTFVADGQDGLRRSYVMTALPGKLRGLYAQPVETITPYDTVFLYFASGFPLLIWVLATITAGHAADRLVIYPLERVRRAIRRYTAGDQSARADDIEASPDEVRAVATTFNSMADTIQARDVALRAAVEHQSALTREINHRVRNNLQVMSSLLSLQSRRAATPDQAAVFLDVRRRLNALGIVHAALYRSNDFRAIDLSLLLQELFQSTEHSLSNDTGGPALSLDAETVLASPDAALTLAFLVTELIAETTLIPNALENQVQQLNFALRRVDGGGAWLTLQTAEPVLTDIMNPRRQAGHINLFHGLLRQLRAQMQILDDGRSIRVILPKLL